METSRTDRNQIGIEKRAKWSIVLIIVVIIAIPRLAPADVALYNAAQSFIDQMNPEDMGEVVHYHAGALVAQPFTNDKTALKASVTTTTDNQKAIYDAMYRGISDTALQTDQGVVIVIVDGNDNISTHNPSDVIEHAKLHKVPVFIVGIAFSLDISTFQLIASQTGGKYYSGSASEIDQICLKIVNGTGVNHPPAISGTPAARISEGSSYDFIPFVTDEDSADILTFQISNQPAWAEFDSSTGRLWGTPDNDDAGSYENIVISVSDGQGGTASLPQFYIVVDNVIVVPMAYTISAVENTLRGVVNADGASTIYNFEYWPEFGSKFYTSYSSAGSGTTDVSVQQNVSGLVAGTRYHYRIVATNSAGTAYGNEMTFETEPMAGEPDPAGPDTLYVETTGYCGWLDPCYTIIQDAIDDAIQGAVVKVAQGFYFEAVVIDKSVTIEIGWNDDFTSNYLAEAVVIE